MKFLHLGDLHLGRSLGEYDQYDDQKYMIDELLDIARDKEVDAIMIAGDVYDKAVPSEKAVELLDYLLTRLSDAGLESYMISGNHDSDDRLAFGKRLFEHKGIHIVTDFERLSEEEAEQSEAHLDTIKESDEADEVAECCRSRYKIVKKIFNDQYGPVNIYMLPFVKASQVRHYFPDEKIETYDDAIAACIRSGQVNTNERNIILSHQFVAGNSKSIELAGSENAAVMNVGLVDQVGTDNYDIFDYAALGHIHAPQAVGRTEVRYSGSMLKYSLDEKEINSEKSVPLVTLGAKGDVEIELIPLKPMRDIRHIKGELRKLLSAENIADPDDFMYVTLTDEEYINDAMAIVQQTYPNTVKLDYDNSHTKVSEETIDLCNLTGKRPFEEIFESFYKQVYGVDMTEDEIAIMRAAASKSGIDM